MPELDRKAASIFAGKVVRKDLVRKVKVGANVPVFVLEYLLGKYCATDDPVAIDARRVRPVAGVGRFLQSHQRFAILHGGGVEQAAAREQERQVAARVHRAQVRAELARLEHERGRR